MTDLDRPVPHRSCNRHIDCDAADQRQRERHAAWWKREQEMARQLGRDHYPSSPVAAFADHCRSDECEECFGS